MEFKRLSDVEIIAEPAESANVLIEENGIIKKAPKATVGGGGGGKSFVVVDNYDTNEKSVNMTYDELRNALENNEFPIGWHHEEGEYSDNSARSIITYVPYEDYIEFWVLMKWGGEAIPYGYFSDGHIEVMGGDG